MAKKKLIFVVILILIILLIAFLPGYTKLQDLISENNQMEKKIGELQNSIVELTKEKERLETDLTYIEKIAREKMGLVKKGEKKLEIKK